MLLKPYYIVFLDLEATVIDSWHNPVFIDRSVKSILSNVEADRFGIFSFAIWSEEDRQHCIRNIVPMLESELGIKIDTSLMPTKRELFEQIKKF